MNEAGFGAEEQATRRARRLAAQRDEAARGRAVDERARERARREVRNWSAGAEGERLVADALAALSRYGWTTLHDVRWPGRPRANIDHIAVGPGGVVVIDAKNWTGEVLVSGAVLRQNGRPRTEAVSGVSEAAAAVTALLAPQHRTAVSAALCLAAQDQEAVAVDGGAVVVGRWQLADHLLGLPVRLTVFDVAHVAGHLGRELAGDGTVPATGSSRGRAPTSPGPARGSSLASGDRPRRPRQQAPRREPGRAPRRRSPARRAVTALVELALAVGLALGAAHLLPGLITGAVERIGPDGGTPSAPATPAAPVDPAAAPGAPADPEAAPPGEQPAGG